MMILIIISNIYEVSNLTKENNDTETKPMS